MGIGTESSSRGLVVGPADEWVPEATKQQEAQIRIHTGMSIFADPKKGMQGVDVHTKVLGIGLSEVSIQSNEP